MTGRWAYVYGGTVEFLGEIRDIDGTADCPQPCDEARLKAVAVNDVARAEGVPLGEIEVTQFWFSELDPAGTGTAGADPFRPFGVPDDHPDPFRPGGA